MSQPKPLRPAELRSQIPRERILQDDGSFMLLSTQGLAYARTDGLLLRRCSFSARAPFGYECRGLYRRWGDSLWHASLYDDEIALSGTGSIEHSSGIFRSELDAVVNLWTSRRLRRLGPTV